MLIRNHSIDTPDESQLRKLVDFNGLNLRVLDLGVQPVGSVTNVLKHQLVVAVLISQEALERLPRETLEAKFFRNGSAPIPALIYGIVPSSSDYQLKLWSSNAIDGCLANSNNGVPRSLIVQNLPEITHTLRSLKFPAVAAASCDLHESRTAPLQDVLRLEGNNASAAALVRTRDAQGGEVFFAPAMKVFDHPRPANPGNITGVFSSSAPFLVFLSYTAKDYKWQLDGRYANLTIDDPWLTEPYGRLDYAALLSEMRKHSFHTTIAFIPWNFDRSSDRVISLFREHPTYFSIAVHGNNHTHQEFAAYTTVPLSKQIADLKQAVARMERFQALTGIPYDRFMVFPHRIAPEQTLVELKRFNFLGTANSSNVPLDRTFPSEQTFLLRPYSGEYGNFLSLSRYPANGEISRLELAVQCFMGNPLLFYGHEDLFERGIGAFDGLADAINQIQSDTKWVSLGELARHLYLIRRVDAGRFQVRMFSNEMELTNPEEQDAEFQITCKEDTKLPISSVTINGAPAPIRRSAKELSIVTVIPAKQVRKIRIFYDNDLNLSRVDVRRTDWRAAVLRSLSDFRDLYLSQLSWGRTVKRTYYRNDWDSLELTLESRSFLTVFAFLLVAIGLFYGRRKIARKQRLRSAQHGA